jgi:hypothetical protein
VKVIFIEQVEINVREKLKNNAAQYLCYSGSDHKMHNYYEKGGCHQLGTGENLH